MEQSIFPIRKIGPLFESTRFKDTKDPCPVYDDTRWHIYGSGGSVRDETWQILHATAEQLDGPWQELEPASLHGVTGEHVAAPGMYYDPEHRMFHMFVQTDFLETGGSIEYLVSSDGHNFERVGIILCPIPDSPEAGLYDPHPAIVNGHKYIVYSGTPRVQHVGTHFISQPDIYLAKSESNEWMGPWRRIGRILDHAAIASHHNQLDHPEYEWGIEGPQLIPLPHGQILLNATCFLAKGRYGTRQRVFFAIADDVTGPYRTLGPVLNNDFTDWESGENGHASGVILGDELHLFYQARSATNSEDVLANNWRYGIALFPLSDLIQK